MRACTKPGCGVMLLDTDATCPVCGSPTESIGSLQQEKQPHSELRVPMIRRRGSCLGVIFAILFGTAVCYILYTRLVEDAGKPIQYSTVGTKLLDAINDVPKKP